MLVVRGFFLFFFNDLVTSFMLTPSKQDYIHEIKVDVSFSLFINTIFIFEYSLLSTVSLIPFPKKIFQFPDEVTQSL